MTKSIIFKSTYKDVTIPNKPLHQVILEEAIKFGDKPALIDYDTKYTITFKQLVAYSNNFAQQFVQTYEAKKGSVIAICMPNHPLYAVVVHGTPLAGLTLTTLNPLYTASDINKQLLDSNAKWMITIPHCLEQVKEGIKGTSCKKIFLLSSEEVKEDENIIDFKTLLAPLKKQVDLSKIVFNVKEDIVYLPYSSGTTGVSKGVMLTHHNIVANIYQNKDFLKFGSDEVFSGILPFFHIFGLMVLLNYSIREGITIVCLARFDFVKFLTMVQTYKITRSLLVPPIIVALAKHPVVDKFNLSTLKYILSGAAPLSAELVGLMKKRLNCTVTQGYGLTETSPVITVQPDSEPIVGGCGRLISNIELRIVDPDTGNDLEAGKRGEVVVRGANVMKGYLGNKKATDHCIKDGWFYTGDIGIYKDNQLYIVDRLKELIKYKGFQVPPAELEALLLTNENIADCAVIGVPDEEAGELPKAYVVKKENSKISEKEILEFVASRTSPQKKIRLVEFIDKIPKSASGKILRRELRDLETTKNKK